MVKERYFLFWLHWETEIKVAGSSKENELSEGTYLSL